MYLWDDQPPRCDESEELLLLGNAVPPMAPARIAGNGYPCAPGLSLPRPYAFFGEVPALPTVAAFKFVNSGKTHRHNCAPVCRGGRRSLGVGIGGTGTCSMELQFALTGSPAGVLYNIRRTRTDSLWERRNGTWSCLQFEPEGLSDDSADDDECLTPWNNTLFVIDRVGFVRTELPAFSDHVFTTAKGVYTHPDAAEVVSRASFVEWVEASQPSSNIPWTAIGPSPAVAWHCILWLIRDTRRQWILDRKRSAIELGALSEQALTTAPA